MRRILIVLIFSGFLLLGCPLDGEGTGAPGCDGGGWMPTGCFGESVIENITVEPSSDCLKVDANNCNGGVLEVENRCGADLEIGGKTVPAGTTYQLLEFARNGDGDIYIIEPEGNFDSYCPENEDVLSVKGMLGDEEITISYTKKNICGEAKTPEASGSVSLEMGKTTFGLGEKIEAYVETDETLYTGFFAYELQKKDGEGWQYLDPYKIACALPCSGDEEVICSGPIACAPIPENCREFDPSSNTFEWDQTEYKTRDYECPDSTQICSYPESAEPGTYKIIFKYSENCVDEEYFGSDENNVQAIEKQFEITETSPKEILYNIVTLAPIECWGCGADILVLEKVYADKTTEEIEEPILVKHSAFGPASKCMEDYEDVADERMAEIPSLDLVYRQLLTDGELSSLVNCISELEDAGYCETAADCCEGYMDEESCGMSCVENTCTGK